MVVQPFPGVEKGLLRTKMWDLIGNSILVNKRLFHGAFKKNSRIIIYRARHYVGAWLQDFPNPFQPDAPHTLPLPGMLCYWKGAPGSVSSWMLVLLRL